MKKKTKIGLGVGLGIYGLLHVPFIKETHGTSTVYVPILDYLSRKLNAWILNMITPLAPRVMVQDSGDKYIQNILGIYNYKIK